MNVDLLKFLKSTDEYVSGEQMCRHFNISRAAIWKNIDQMRKLGYAIDAVPHLGYKLTTSPDKLFPWEIEYFRKTNYIGKTYYHHETLKTTMDEAFRLGVDGADEGTVVCAESQSQGKGRMGRSWVSPRSKGLYFSVILRPNVSPNDIAQLTLLSAVAVQEGIKNTCGLSAQIKWPNDLLINNKKCAGILTEISADMDRVRFVVVGVGINVNTNINNLPEGSTSLKCELNKNVSRAELAMEVFKSLEGCYEQLKDEGFKPIIDRWKQLSCTLGSRIRFVNQGEEIEGEAIDLDEYGGLIIRNDEGLSIKKMSGDVVPIC